MSRARNRSRVAVWTAIILVLGIGVGANFGCDCPDEPRSSPSTPSETSSLAELEARAVTAEAEWERLRQLMSANCTSLDSLSDEDLKQEIRVSGPGLF